VGKLIVVTRSQKDAQLDPVTGKDYLEYCDGHKVDPNVTRPQGGWVIDPEKFEGHPKSKEGEVIYDDKGRPKRIFPDAYDLAMRQARRMANSRPGATIREVEGPGVVGHADGAPRLPYIGPVPLEQYPGGPPTGQAPQPEPAAAEPVPDHQKPSKRRGKKKVDRTSARRERGYAAPRGNRMVADEQTEQTGKGQVVVVDANTPIPTTPEEAAAVNAQALEDAGFDPEAPPEE
jgi:hypothetical protein